MLYQVGHFDAIYCSVQINILLTKPFTLEYLSKISLTLKNTYIFNFNISDIRGEKLRTFKSLIPEPEWLTEDMKNIFKYEIHILKNGLRLTKLSCIKEKL